MEAPPNRQDFRWVKSQVYVCGRRVLRPWLGKWWEEVVTEKWGPVEWYFSKVCANSLECACRVLGSFHSVL